MRAKIDENMPADAARLLTETGWETSTVHDEHLAGAADELVVAACQREDRVLFSLDLDFADIRRYPPGEYSGVVRPPAGQAGSGQCLRSLGQRSRPSHRSPFVTDSG